MKKEEIKTLSRLRIEKADELLKEAEFNLKNKFYQASVNRSYYAVFSAINSLLILEGTSVKTHSGLKTLFNLRFIKTKKLPLKYSEYLDYLMRKRTDVDYGDFVVIDEKTARKTFRIAKEMLKNIKQLRKKLENALF